MQKTFHIGEYCKYGTIKVTRDDLHCKVEVMDYKTKKVRARESFHFVDKAKMHWFLENYTTAYYADKIINHFYV